MSARVRIRGVVAGPAPAVVLAGLLVGVLAGCDVPPAPQAVPKPAPSAAASRETACPDGIRLVEGEGNAAMGLRVADVRLVNCGTQPYVLEGYPDIRFLDEESRPVEVAAGHGSNGISTGTGLDSPPQRVTLQPGQAASVGLLWRNLVTDATVPAADVWALDIRPRPGVPHRVLKLTRSIDLGNTGRIGVGPWVAVTG